MNGDEFLLQFDICVTVHPSYEMICEANLMQQL